MPLYINVCRKEDVNLMSYMERPTSSQRVFQRNLFLFSSLNLPRPRNREQRMFFYPFAAFIASVSAGTTSNRSPTMP